MSQCTENTIKTTKSPPSPHRASCKWLNWSLDSECLYRLSSVLQLFWILYGCRGPQSQWDNLLTLTRVLLQYRRSCVGFGTRLVRQSSFWESIQQGLNSVKKPMQAHGELPACHGSQKSFRNLWGFCFVLFCCLFFPFFALDMAKEPQIPSLGRIY